jgi:uncharacterized protein (TIGR00369 family)
VDQTIVYDDPANRCFGCSPHNAFGLRLRFQPTADGVEALYQAPEHFCGAPGVIHGGIQAALLDEVMGVATHASRRDQTFDLVTVDFRLRDLRPAPSGRPLRVRGRVLRTEGRDYFLEGEIAAEDGTVLTSAQARWRRIDRS